MNLDNISSGMMDDMATDYLNGMYESQYDDFEEPTDEQLEKWMLEKKSEIKQIKNNCKNTVEFDEEIPF